MHLLTSTQRIIAQEFFDKHLPGQSIDGVKYDARKPKFFGMQYMDAVPYAQSFALALFKHDSAMGESEFEEQMLAAFNRVPKLQAMASKALPANRFGRWGSAWHAANYLNQASALELPLPKLLDSLELHLKIARQWFAQKATSKTSRASHRIEHGTSPHPESLIALRLLNKDGFFTASAGGYAHYEDSLPTFRITNLQGSRQHNFDELNAELGENWRVHLVKKLVATATKHGLSVTGAMPKRFYRTIEGDRLPTASDREYKRQLRQYKQAYKKAGLHEHADGLWRSEKLRV